MAFLSGSVEIIFPILLVLGFGTRFAATGLLFMTLIVELTVPDGWPIHITWAAMELGIMAWGPGALSADYLIRHFLNLPTKRGGRGSHTVWTLRSVAERPAARTGGGSLVDSPKSPF
jgi:hypothetical protein